MNTLKRLLSEIPELQDQLNLFENCLNNQKLDEKYKKYVAYAAALATKNQDIIILLEEQIGTLTKEEKKAVTIASSRMAVTNPYFMSRNITTINSGGTLESLDMRIFPKLKVEDEMAYHYACVAISLINGGYVCFNSHIHSLRASKESEESIDLAIRLSSSINSLNQLFFNSKFI